MRGSAGVVLAGGRSSRMGSSKAALEWHGSTLLRRTVGILARFGPVVVVRAAGQSLPALPPDVVVVDDPRAGKGPLQGIAAGLAAIGGRAEYAFVCATDLPFLHPAFVRRVSSGRTRRQPSSAAFSTIVSSRERFTRAIRRSRSGPSACHIAPRIAIRVPNRLGVGGDQLNVELKFKNMDDFNPVAVIENAPALRKLDEGRKRLRDLLTTLDGHDEL